MKGMLKLLGVVAIITAVFLSGCASVRVRGPASGISSVIPGRSIELRIRGDDNPIVSSTRDGSGPVASGTYVSNGVLYVDPHERALLIFIIARSAKDDREAFTSIRVVSVDEVGVTPVDGTAVATRTLQFSAEVTGNNTPDDTVTWRVGSNPDGSGSASSGTTINSRGLLSVARGETNQTLYITATSVIDPSKSAVVNVNIVVPTVTSVMVSPSSVILTRGESLQFQATITGEYDHDQTVTWRVSSNPEGTTNAASTITDRGLLTVVANEPARALYVIATSTLDPSMRAVVVIDDIRDVHACNYVWTLSGAIRDLENIGVRQVCSQDASHIGETNTVTLDEYLATHTGTVENPLALVFQLNLGDTSQENSLWRGTLQTAIAAADQYVNLDLSACTMANATFSTGATSTTTTVQPGMDRVITLTLPNSTTATGDYAFEYSTVREVIFPAGLTTINNGAFYNCRFLEKVTLPTSLTTLGSSVFNGCTALAEITIPQGVTTLNAGLFAGTTSLQRVIFTRPTPPTIGSTTLIIPSSSTARFMVPAGSVNAWKIGQGLAQEQQDRWAQYLRRIHAVGCNDINMPCEVPCR